jgi:glycosyltransferase involved in cell wall biosynthesis
MHIVFVSDLEALGGAGIAASRLANGLADKGVTVTRLFNNPNVAPFGERVGWSREYVGPQRPLEICLNGLRRVSPRAGYRLGNALSGAQLERALRRLRFDVLHVHGIHASYWNHDTFGRLDSKLPVVWTFHDYWGFTPESYLYRDRSGELVRCKPDGDRAAAMHRRKLYFDSRERCALVANNRAMATAVHEALGREALVIPYGVPLDVFRPLDKAAARASLGLGAQSFVVGFIADNRSDPIKGFSVLQEALQRLTEPVEAIAIGEGSGGTTNLGRARVHLFSRVTSPKLLAILYSAADVFVVPSLAEALVVVGLESMACGTPVLGSGIGGILDEVVPGTTGWLFPPGDVQALTALLSRLAIDRSEARALSASCRERAETLWSMDAQADAYLAVYSDLLRNRSAA